MLKKVEKKNRFKHKVIISHPGDTRISWMVNISFPPVLSRRSEAFLKKHWRDRRQRYKTMPDWSGRSYYELKYSAFSETGFLVNREYRRIGQR